MSVFKTIAWSVLAALPSIAQAELMLTGEVSAKNAESFFAPRVNSWQIQIEWMLPEGQIAKPGELVVLFDRASVDSEIEMKEADLLKKQDQLNLAKAQGEESIMDAEFNYEKAKLELKKAEIEAGIGKTYVSAYEHEKANVEMQRRLLAVDKSERQLAAKKEEVKTDIEKKLTEIQKAQYDLALLKKKSKLTALYTENGGPMVYASHPWNGSKITSGSSVQATWKVAEVASSKEMRITAWLNEVDKDEITKGAKVKVSVDALPGKTFTGVVSHIVPQAEERAAWGSAAYFEVYIDIDDYHNAGLVPGMSVLVEVI